ncbi:MAG: hypothetical protein IPI60_04830 [Saprospiraceae bacterium]|nr:hypothetical protein [Saprospiraceae bacterium]
MSKNWKDKGWNNMASILDEAMPVRRTPLFPPFPVQLRIATLVLLIAGSAYWGYNLVSQEPDQSEISAFRFNTNKDLTTAEPDIKVLKSTELSASKMETTFEPKLFTKRTNNSSSAFFTSNTVGSDIQQPLQSGIDKNISLADILQVSDDEAVEQDITISPAAPDLEDSKFSEVSVINSANQVNASVEPQPHSISDETVRTEIKTDQSELLQAEASPIVKPKLNTSFSIGASAGNYTFSDPTLYGQLQFNMHIPISQSLNVTVLAATGKGLLYQNTEVLLAEYNNNPSDGTVLGAEAPDDDLSAYLDVKSVSNALIGTQVQWQISNKWTFAIGATAAYLFNIQHQAIQSTSLVPVGQSPQQIYTPSEITEKFAHWNEWDLRMNTSIQYHLTGNWSMSMSYNRGFANLLKHPISSDHNIQMNSLTLGLNYRF